MTDSDSKWKARVERERLSRKAAESLLEEKSLELYHINQKLSSFNENLEKRIVERTKELEVALKKAEEAGKAKTNFLPRSKPS